MGSRSGVTTGSGPGGGSFGKAYHGGVAVGPQGGAAVGGKVGAATGPGGNTVAGGSRAGVAAGPYGAAAGRTAVGICSNLYVSGLSVADCIFSGRRAGRSAAGAALAKHGESVQQVDPA